MTQKRVVVIRAKEAWQNTSFINEIMLVLLGDIRIWLILIVLTAVETGFGVAKYELGKEGKNEVEKHFPEMNQKRWQQAEQWFKRWGDPVLLLTAVIEQVQFVSGFLASKTADIAI